MRLVRRNTTLFDYMAFQGLESDIVDGYHTGVPKPIYGDNKTMRGTISAPSGAVAQAFAGLEDAYTHTLVMDSPDTGIKEDGLITWKGDKFVVKAVRPSINFTLIALRKMLDDHDEIVIEEPEEEIGGMVK